MSRDWLQIRLEEIDRSIAYEKAPGVHTYHQCRGCGKAPTRQGQCVACLEDERGQLRAAKAAMEAKRKADQ